MAENSAFVTGFFRGIAEKESFAKLVCGLYFVYDAMEKAFEESSCDNVKALDYPELRRIPVGWGGVGQARPRAGLEKAPTGFQKFSTYKRRENLLTLT